ncbi:MAG: nucleotide exchange factor GrpE [Halanaerobiaceae bacterium]|nr:nucleotide exchange factor GrpE [Halanaerobiaceae bacterium]
MENNINGRSEEEMEAAAADQAFEEESPGSAAEQEAELQKEAVEGTGEAEEAAETEGKEAAETDDDMGEQGTAELLETIDKLEKKLAEHEQEKEALNNRLVRLQADFSNYRKRNEKEAEKLQSAIVAGLIEELLPVLDNFDRALTQEGSGEDFRKGIEMIHRQLLDFLEKQGVENIEAVGKEFDHNYHNAVQQVESDEYESGTVVKEILKGYILNNDIVIRPSMVIVAK